MATTVLSERRLRRVLLALDVVGAPPAMLSFAVTLAAHFEAELEAMLLAQSQLSRAATLPFASEVSLLAGMERRLSGALMERSLRGLTARIQTMMAELAGPARIRWTLQTAAKRGWEDLLAELDAGSLLVSGHDGRYAAAPGARASSGACVVYDDTPAGQDALAIAEAVDTGAQRIEVTSAEPQRMARVAARLLSLRPGTLILPAAVLARHAPILHPLLARLGCTVVVVG